ncbi:hypothetical protein TL16_g10030 [Triparma laevis f. inornata]|uniref:Uncharacterized protein n=1 Tax=Triparma laevis f. inornata TaxID=1714386 RepID=A0A9W7BB94_9STRA|nr:hypothetical protein TL16_g10030 [Triparma laevis f. inornata]
MFVQLLVDQREQSLLNDEALKNMNDMSVTFPTFQPFRSLLNDLVLKNIAFLFVQFPTDQPERSLVNDSTLLNIHDMSATFSQRSNLSDHP